MATWSRGHAARGAAEGPQRSGGRRRLWPSCLARNDRRSGEERPSPPLRHAPDLEPLEPREAARAGRNLTGRRQAIPAPKESATATTLDWPAPTRPQPNAPCDMRETAPFPIHSPATPKTTAETAPRSPASPPAQLAPPAAATRACHHRNAVSAAPATRSPRARSATAAGRSRSAAPAGSSRIRRGSTARSRVRLGAPKCSSIRWCLWCEGGESPPRFSGVLCGVGGAVICSATGLGAGCLCRSPSEIT
jgi:hypothetical protein